MKKKKASSQEHSSLQARIKLLKRRRRVIRRPLRADRLNGIQRDRLGDILNSFEKLDTQPLADMPGNMTMEQPGSGVITPEGDDQPSRAGKHGRVPTSGVVELESGAVGGVYVH